MRNKISKFFKLINEKLFQINDSPQRIALGLGIGVFSGILPGTGPLAALFLSFVFRVNRASALLGCLLTNTWLSFIILILAIKVGSAILDINWRQVYGDWLGLISSFHWANFLSLSALKVILPVILGYFLVGLSLAILVYLTSFFAISFVRYRRIKW